MKTIEAFFRSLSTKKLSQSRKFSLTHTIANCVSQGKGIFILNFQHIKKKKGNGKWKKNAVHLLTSVYVSHSKIILANRENSRIFHKIMKIWYEFYNTFR